LIDTKLNAVLNQNGRFIKTAEQQKQCRLLMKDYYFLNFQYLVQRFFSVFVCTLFPLLTKANVFALCFVKFTNAQKTAIVNTTFEIWKAPRVRIEISLLIVKG